MLREARDEANQLAYWSGVEMGYAAVRLEAAERMAAALEQILEGYINHPPWGDAEAALDAWKLATERSRHREPGPDDPPIDGIYTYGW